VPYVNDFARRFAGSAGVELTRLRLGLVTVGSTGDVSPILALSLGLQRAGHEVRVVAPSWFAATARGLGIDFRPLRDFDPQALLQSERGRATFAIRNPIRAWRAFGAIAEPEARSVLDDAVTACEGVDAVGFSGLGMFPGLVAAAALRVPYFAAHLVPIGTTADFPSALLPQRPAWLPGYNRASHALARWLVWRTFAPLASRARPGGQASSPFPSWAAMLAGARVSLFGISPAVLPPPETWASWSRFTGYWFLDRSGPWQPPPELLDFLARGPPPVVVGFGSMSGRQPGRTTEVVLEALGRAGVRGIILSGWGGLESGGLPSSVMSLASAPHEWLFPRAAAAVHHGGAGTTASAVRAGVPSVVVPFAFDQPFWGARLRKLGVAPDPIPERRLTPTRLGAAIRVAVGDARMRRTAQALGERIRAEDGVGVAVKEIELALRRRPAPVAVYRPSASPGDW